MELEEFVTAWDQDIAGAKPLFIELKKLLESLEETQIHFIARPGITYSMRGKKTSQEKRPLFVMVDVIDDDPAERWLSVCFFGDTITDPEELGDFVPGGLLGEDGHCFDAEDAGILEYIKARILEAHGNQ
ncbi:hypothetical protein [Pseudodesulfovibrio piezophilus]|uniref:Uncharacterized protein n=1 Tax=Pseudodesulfovibrio piezophilus (strain DSM 21447 / JCM 15486 / C1TLV30) TaxID=1322246 RepID=M1WVK9_PSEP2|nr:hypothetical protein [Pseudodesulfovibrio piezophilus]CCH48563.1 conserved protein of unknown function [Pseudodesulfovibrio piezophilus C1TLV30]